MESVFCCSCCSLLYGEEDKKLLCHLTKMGDLKNHISNQKDIQKNSKRLSIFGPKSLHQILVWMIQLLRFITLCFNKKCSGIKIRSIWVKKNFTYWVNFVCFQTVRFSQSNFYDYRFWHNMYSQLSDCFENEFSKKRNSF